MGREIRLPANTIFRAAVVREFSVRGPNLLRFAIMAEVCGFPIEDISRFVLENEYTSQRVVDLMFWSMADGTIDAFPEDGLSEEQAIALEGAKHINRVLRQAALMRVAGHRVDHAANLRAAGFHHSAQLVERFIVRAFGPTFVTETVVS